MVFGCADGTSGSRLGLSQRLGALAPQVPRILSCAQQTTRVRNGLDHAKPACAGVLTLVSQETKLQLVSKET
jgi:hypothetical protein